MLLPGTYHIALPGASISTDTVIYKDLAGDFTVNEDGSVSTSEFTVSKDTEATEAKQAELQTAEAKKQQEEGDKAQREKEAAEETQRQKDAEAAQSRRATDAAAQAQDSQKNEQTVYVTDTGKKYHSDGYQYLKKSKIAISLDKAKARGYSPCSKCHPPL